MARKFDKEFKQDAVNLLLEKKLSISGVSKDLGVGLSTLQRWVREGKTSGESAFPGKGYLKPEDERLRKLERENEVLRRERDILKKALVSSSGESNKSV